MAEGLSDLWVMQHNNVDGPPHRSLRIDFTRFEASVLQINR